MSRKIVRLDELPQKLQDDIGILKQSIGLFCKTTDWQIENYDGAYSELLIFRLNADKVRLLLASMRILGHHVSLLDPDDIPIPKGKSGVFNIFLSKDDDDDRPHLYIGLREKSKLYNDLDGVDEK